MALPTHTDEKSALHNDTVRPERRRVSSQDSMNGPLYMQTRNKTVLVRRIKRKGNSPMKQLARWFVENQIGFSFNLLALLFFAHFLLPKAKPYTERFFRISHYNERTGQYAAGSSDVYFVLFVIILVTGLRAATMEYILAPLAKAVGCNRKKDVTRFSEQGWMLVYYAPVYTVGLYMYYYSPYFMSLKELWTNWPERELDGLLKAYLLTQLAFWFQQLLVINIEERRKDHWQMFTHHLVTITLIVASYRYHFNRVGHLILVLFDLGDLFLSTAKCLKYAGYSTLCDIGFGVFMVSWLICRHIIYLAVCWSIATDLPATVKTACYTGSMNNLQGPKQFPTHGWSHLLEPFGDPEGRVCFSRAIGIGFLGVLLVLQVITIVWFAMIVKVAIRVLKGAGADDVRSDDEGDDFCDEDDELEDVLGDSRTAILYKEESGVTYVYEDASTTAPLEEEVGVESLNLKSWERRAAQRRKSPSVMSSASGVSLPGHSDRKELLGRIGCEKQVE